MQRFSHALARYPSPRYAGHYAPKGINISDELTRAQHQEYISALKRAGVEVTVLPPHEQHHDCVFIEDTAIVAGKRALITHMNDVRQGEQDEVLPWLAKRFEIHHVPQQARIEGGDVLHLDDLILVGQSSRTNEMGIQALREFFQPIGMRVLTVPVTKCLHLKSGVTYLGDRTLLVSPALLDLQVPPNYSSINVDPNEPHAGNVLRVNDSLIVSIAFPRTNQTLRGFAESRNLRLLNLDISEAQKGDGALTCQSILF